MLSNDASQPAPAPPALGRNLSFHLLWSSTFASGLGDRIALFAALALLGYAGEGADNSSIASGVEFCFFLPYLLWSPLAGWLTDRLPRWRVLLAADELRGLFVLTVFLMLPAGLQRVPDGSEWMVWAMVGAIGAAAATMAPARLSVLPNVVGMTQLTRANAVVVPAGIVGNLAGLPLGGALAESSVRLAVLVAAGCYMISGLAWLFLRTPYRRHSYAAQPPPAGHLGAPGSDPGAPGGHTSSFAAVGRQILDGLRYAWSHRPLRVLILTAALVWTGTAIYKPALAVVNVEMYGGGIESFGLVAAPVGLGILLGALAVGLLNPRLGAELCIALGLVGTGLFIALQMIVPSFALGLLIGLAVGVSAGVLLAPLNAMLQRATADHMRGRVFAAKEVVAELGGVVVAGLIWQIPNTDPAMRPLGVALGVVLVIAGVYGFRRFVLSGPQPAGVLNLVWRVCRLWTDGLHRVRVRGKGYVPREGGVLLVSNHTAGVDPLLIQSAVPRPIRWMTAREYLMKPMGWLWKLIRPIPVRRGERDTAAIRAAVDGLRAGEIIGIFPEGGIGSKEEGLRPFEPGVGMIARRGRAVIVPVHVSGTPETPSPTLSFLLPCRGRVRFGEPFTLDDAAGDRKEWLAEIRRRIERLET